MDFSFLDTIPLSPHQREYVKACWKKFPENGKQPSPPIKLFRQSGIIWLAMIGLLVTRVPATVMVTLAVIWLFSVVGSVAVVYLFNYSYHIAATRPSTSRQKRWGDFNGWDKIVTSHDQLTRLIPWHITLETVSSLVGSLMLLLTLVLTRHWVTAIGLGLLVVTTCIFSLVMTPMIKNTIKNRARAYAEHFNLEPEIDPSQINPDHPRPVLK